MIGTSGTLTRLAALSHEIGRYRRAKVAGAKVDSTGIAFGTGRLLRDRLILALHAARPLRRRPAAAVAVGPSP